MAAHMEQLLADLDKSAASLADAGTKMTAAEEQHVASQLDRSFEAEDWGSIADILKSIESPSPAGSGRGARLSPQHHRLTPLSENIQCSVPPTPPLSPTESKPGGQGMQQLDHLLRMMEQMCSLQKQNSKLKEQAEYLTAIKNLQELRNETLRENCHCDSHHRSSDPTGGVRFEPLQMPEETLSEPESIIGDDMHNGVRQRERRNSRARTVKRESKARSLKKRSRSADPYGNENKDLHQREKGRPGIFSKIEKMKEKLTTRRGSVKRHPPKGREDLEGVGRRLEHSTESSYTHYNLDGSTETKSEDSGIYHVDREDHVTSRPEMLLQKANEDFSDSEEVFSTPPLAPSTWGKPGPFVAVDGSRKNSDFSTGSSSEDYLELKPKRHHHGNDLEASVVYRRRRRDLSPHRLTLENGSGSESRKKLVRRSASFQDNVSLNSDDDYEDAKSQWESKEAPAVLQGFHESLHQSHSIPFTGHHRHQPAARSNSSEMKAAQKRKFLHRSNQVDETDSAPGNEEHRPYSIDFLPEKKRPKGWDKVKHAVTRKHAPSEVANKKGFSEFYMELSTEDQEAYANAEAHFLADMAARDQRSDDRSRLAQHKASREHGAGQSSGSSAATSSNSLAMIESLQANLSDDFTKKMEKWDRKKTRKGGAQLEKTKQPSLDSASSDATSTQSPTAIDELQKNLSDDFTKKMLEWDRKKQRGGAGGSPPTEAKRKHHAKQGKAKAAGNHRPGSKIIKNRASAKGKESPQVRRRSQSPDGRKTPYSTEEIYSKENIALLETEDGEVVLEGVSKEFNKRYKEWEKMKKMGMLHHDGEDLGGAHKHRLDHENMDGKDARRVAIIEQYKSSSSDQGDVYLVAHAMPVVVEPEFDRSQEEEIQAELDGAASESTEGGQQPLNRLEQRNSLLAAKLKHGKDVNLQAVSNELQNMQEQIDRITGEKHEMRRASACSSLGESALEVELSNIKSQIQLLEEEFENSPTAKDRSQEEVKGRKRRSRSRAREDKVSVRKQDESTSTEAMPEKIEVEVQTNDPDKDTQTDDTADADRTGLDSPTSELRKCLHEREAIIMLLQAEVDRQANELNYLRNGDSSGSFRRAKSFSARDRKTFDSRAMRIIDIPLQKSDKLEDLAEKADEMPELPTRRLEDFPVTHRDKSDTLSSRSSQDSKRESLMSIQSSNTASSLEALHISAEDIRMEESCGSEASDKARSIRSQASDTSSLETKSEPIRKVSLERKMDKKERESSPESATSLLRKRRNRDAIEILPNKRDMVSSRPDVKGGEDFHEKETIPLPSSPSRLRRVSEQSEATKAEEDRSSTENIPQSPRKLMHVNQAPGSPVRVVLKYENHLDSNKGSSESLGSKDGKSMVQERKEMFAIRGRLEKSASLDSSLITGPHSRGDTPHKLDSSHRKDSIDSTSSTSSRKSISSAWEEKHGGGPVLSKSKKPEDKSVNNLRKKFSTMEYGSAPNVSEVGHQSLKDKYTPRTRREVPKQGCVRQLSQAFSMVSLMDGAGEQKGGRGSQSSSVKSSPRSLSPASSTNSLIADKIKKLQDKATGSSPDGSLSRRQSEDVSKSSTRDNSPSPSPLVGTSPLVSRREYRQSLPNIAAVRARFDKVKTEEKTSPLANNSSENNVSEKKDVSASGTHKPARSRSTPGNRITYKVSVVNDNGKEKDQAGRSSSSPKDTKKAEGSLRVRAPRLVAVIESPPEKEEEETVTFTVNPKLSRGRQTSPRKSPTNGNDKSNGGGNVRRKTQMFIATVEETTTVTKKPKETVQEKEIKKVAIEDKPVSSGSRPKGIQVSSAVRPKELNVNSSKPLGKSGKEEAGGRGRRRRRELSSPTALSPDSASKKAVDTATTNKVQSPGRSPGRRNRNRRDGKSQETDSRKTDGNKVDRKKSDGKKADDTKPSGRGGPRREKRETKTEAQTEAQRKDAILARRERREAREAREAGGQVEKKESKKDKSEGLDRKDNKNTKGDKKAGHVERKESNAKSKKESVKVERKESKTKKDVRLQRTESNGRTDKKDTDSPLRSLRRRRSKKDELNAPGGEFDSTSEGASGNSEMGDSTSQGSDYPDLLATTRKGKKEGSKRSSSSSGSSRCARAVVAHSALKGAEALIGTPLPKASEEENANERKSTKDKSRRGRAINRADRISRLDLFRRARSVDSSKVTKDRSPSHDRGKGDRAQSVDRSSGKNRDGSVDRQKGDGKNWLSKRTGSITNFLRASNLESWDVVDPVTNSALSVSSNPNLEESFDFPASDRHDNCHHDSGFHDGTSTSQDVLHVGSNDEYSCGSDSDEYSCDDDDCSDDDGCDSMYESTSDDSADTQMSS